MKRTLLTTLFLLAFSTSLTLHAQKVKISKGIVYVDKVEYLTHNKDYGKDVISTLQGDEFVSIGWVTYDVPNPARQNTHDPNRYKYPATTKKSYAVVTFLSLDIEFEAEITRKKLLLAFYNDGLVDENGVVNEEIARKLAKKIGSDISSTVPGRVIITH